ncbi:MAG: 50S ribosomal protein L15 [Planctomycetes bacterium]|nr:50S ribosomal protein L15 [Planctomycetota bacterium]
MNLCDAKKPYTHRDRHFTICRGKGTGRGKTGGRGGKGQSARSGYSRHDYFEGGTMPLIRRLPKRGFNNKRFARKVAAVNLRDLNRFDANTTVNPEALVRAGLVKHVFEWVKILGEGVLDRPLTVAAHRFSEDAVLKIQKAGGKVEWLLPAPEAKPEPPKAEGPVKSQEQRKAERKAKRRAARAAAAAVPAKGAPAAKGKAKEGKEGKEHKEAKEHKEGKPKEGKAPKAQQGDAKKG